MEYSELIDWLAFFELEPFGTEIDFLHSGIIASTYANINSPKKKFKPTDFIPNFGRKNKSWEEQYKQFEQYALAIGAKDERSK